MLQPNKQPKFLLVRSVFLIVCILVILLGEHACIATSNKMDVYKIKKTACDGSSLGDRIQATSAFVSPNQIAIVNNSLVFTDTYNGRIRIIDENGIITSITGWKTQSFYPANGALDEVQTIAPVGLAVDPSNGDIIFGDTTRLRRISNGYVSTIAGSTSYGPYYGDGVLATSARLNTVTGIAISNTSDIFFADNQNFRIRKVSGDKIYLVAGNGTAVSGLDGSLAVSAGINIPTSVALNSLGEVVFAEKCKVRKIDLSGKLRTIAGNGVCTLKGDGGPANLAQTNPNSITIDGNDNIFITESQNYVVRKISSINGYIYTVAGTGVSGTGTVGSLAISTTLITPTCTIVTQNGDLLIADKSYIRRVSNQTLYNFAGDTYLGENQLASNVYCKPNSVPQYSYGSITFAENIVKEIGADGIIRFPTRPSGYVNYLGSAYILGERYILSDTYNIKKLLPSGSTVQIAGSNGMYGSAGLGGPAKNALLYSPTRAVLNSLGELIILENGNHRIVKIRTDGTLVLVAGSGDSGFLDSTNSSISQFNYPMGIAINSRDEILVADRSNNRIRKIFTNGTVITVAGTGIYAAVANNILATNAYISSPYSVAFSPDGNDFYIAENSNNLIRKVNSSGIITTAIGTGLCSDPVNNIPVATATVCSPQDVFVTSNNEIYFVETNKNVVRKLSNGRVYIVAGLGPSNQNNVLPNATSLSSPNSVYVDKNGEVYIVEGLASVIRKIGLNGLITTIAGTGSSGFKVKGYDALKIDLAFPNCAFPDSKGNVYICDSNNQRMRLLSPNGTMSTIAGGFGDTFENSRFSTSEIVTFNNSLYFFDSSNVFIRKFDFLSLTSSIVAGNGLMGSFGDGVLASEAPLSVVNLAIRSNGDIYMSDTSHIIRKVDISTGIISTIAGTLGTSGFKGDGGLASQALLSNPAGLAVTSSGDVYFVDNGGFVRKINSTTGIISTIAGTDIIGASSNWQESDDATVVKLNYPKFMFLGENEDVYVSTSSGIAKLIPSFKCTVGYYGDDCKLFDCYGIPANESSVCSFKGTCVSYNNCSCIDGFNGQTCQQYSCYGIQSNHSSVCSSHGLCNSPNNCTCSIDYYGNTCSEFYCYGIISSNSSICSQHGSCMSPNNCSCISGYYGDDCSEYNCYGINSLNSSVCSSNGECTLFNHCSCDEGYYGDDCSKYTCFDISSLNESVCSGKGVCSSLNNCSCVNGYYGEDCSKYDCNGINSLNATVCSGKGKCASSNNCSCNIGYSGDDCEKHFCFGVMNLNSSVCSSHGLCISSNNCSCQNGYYGDNCSLFTCFGMEKTNQSVCSYHGKCLSFNNCTCDSGYTGNDCSQFNCYGISPLNSSACSGNGKCASFNNCSCTVGYFGDECQQYFCFGVSFSNSTVCSSHGACDSSNNCSCVNGYYGDDCSKYNCFGIKSTNNSIVCSSHGLCISPEKCSCENGYYGNDCSQYNCYGTNTRNSSVCSSNGECISVNTCSCKKGYYGDDCSTFDCFGIEKTNQSVCSKHGKCLSFNNCTCDNGYTGDDCSQFNCYGDEYSSSGVCSGKGKCTSSNNCSCNIGYSGDECEKYFCFGVMNLNSSVCSSHGSCISPNNCTCSGSYYSTNCDQFDCFGVASNEELSCSGKGRCVSPDKCECNSGYYGEDCSRFECFGVKQTNSSACSSNGKCISLNNCSCNDGYSGAECREYNCFGTNYSNESVCSTHGKCVTPNQCQCLKGYFGNTCEIVQCFGKFSNETQVCSGNGQCSSPDFCTCKKGYRGENCQFHTCFGKLFNDSSVCSGNGVCKQVDVCECNSKSKVQVSGFQCETISCLGKSNQFYPQNNSKVCSGKGACSIESGGCNCTSGYLGDYCQLFTCNGIESSISNVCNGKGSCIDHDKCVCNQTDSTGYWNGNNCDKCLPNYESELSGCKTRKCDSVTTCNSHGVCNASLLCECNGNWDGVFCSACKPNYFGLNCGKFCDRSTCSGHGTCSVDGNCICDSNSNLGYFEGSSCDKCQSGYYGNECSTQIIGPVKFLNMFNGIKFKLFAPKSFSLNNVNCSKLVRSSISKLGSDPICSWTDKLNGDFQILFGQEFSLNIGDSLGFDRNVFNVAPTKEDITLETIQNADSPVTPTATMNGKTSVSSCESIYIDGSGSFSGDRKPLIYHWSVKSSPVSLPLVSSEKSDKLEVNSTEAGVYVFSLYVESSISGRVSETVELSITKLSIPLPSVSILEVSTSLTANSVPLLLKKIITLPQCYYPDQSMKIEWIQLSGPAVDSQIDSNNNLMIKKFNTAGDQSYSFKVTVTSNVNSQSFSTALINFKTQSSQMELSIYPSDVSKGSATLAIEFNDPDKSSDVESWTWTCQDVTNNADCGPTISQLLSLSPKSVQSLILPSDDFKSITKNPLLRILLTITKGSRVISSFAEIAFPTGEIIPPTISLIKYSPSTVKILKTDTLSLDLDVTVNGEKFGYENYISREWKLNGIVLTLSNPVLNKMSELLNSIVINPSSLDEGSSYTISLTITDNRINQFSTFSYQFSIASAPQPCACSLTPASGYALETVFTFSCVNCQNEQKSLLLSYGFGRDTSNITLFTGTTSYATKLPLTNREFVKITDTITGASTFVSVTTKVLVPVVKSITEAKKKLATYNTYEKSLKDGDPNKLVFNSATITECFNAMYASLSFRRRDTSLNCVHGVFEEQSQTCKCNSGYAKFDCSVSVEIYEELRQLRIEMMNNTIDQFKERNIDELMTQDYLILELMIIDSLFLKYDEIDIYIINNGFEILQKVIELALLNKNLKVDTNFDSLIINIVHSIRRFMKYNDQMLSFDLDKLLRDVTTLILRRIYVGEKDIILSTEYSTIVSNKIYRNKYSGLTIFDNSNSSIILPITMPQFLSETSNRKPLSFYMSTSTFELGNNSQVLVNSKTEDENSKNETVTTFVSKTRSKMIGVFGIDVLFQNISNPIAYTLQLDDKLNRTSQIINVFETKSSKRSTLIRTNTTSTLYCATPFNSTVLMKDDTCTLIIEDNSLKATCLCSNQRRHLILEEQIIQIDRTEKVFAVNDEVPVTSVLPTQFKNYDYLAAFIVPFVVLFIFILVSIVICVIVVIRKRKANGTDQGDKRSIEMVNV